MINNDKPLANLISRISSIYTRYFNKKYNYIGHLFQDRYYSELIEDDKQMLETSRIEELLFEMEIRGDIKQSGEIFTHHDTH